MIGYNYLPYVSHTALPIFAIRPSRVTSSSVELQTNTEIARCLLFGSVMMPTSLVAGDKPCALVGEVPVLCARTVPAGNPAFKRFGPVDVSVMILYRNSVLVFERTFPW